MKKEDLIKLGFVANPHGIKGEAELRLFNNEDSVLDDGMTVFLFPSSPKSKISNAGEEWVIQKIRFGNKVICQFEGVKDRTHLESLIPFEIYQKSINPLIERLAFWKKGVNFLIITPIG